MTTESDRGDWTVPDITRDDVELHDVDKVVCSVCKDVDGPCEHCAPARSPPTATPVTGSRRAGVDPVAAKPATGTATNTPAPNRPRRNSEKVAARIRPHLA